MPSQTATWQEMLRESIAAGRSKADEMEAEGDPEGAKALRRASDYWEREARLRKSALASSEL